MPICHITRGTALESLYPAGVSQLSPSQALVINEGYSFSRKDPISLGIPVTRHFDNGKTRPAKQPAVPTNPDRSCTYLVLRAHRMSKTTGWYRPWLPRGRRTSPRFGPALEGALAPQSTSKTKVGPCWRSFIQSKLSRVSHKSPNRVRNAKSRNITPV